METPFSEEKKEEKQQKEAPGEEEVKRTELSMLKERAKLMGIDVPNNIGVETLKARIQAKLDGESKVAPQAASPAPSPASAPAATAPAKDEETPRPETEQERRMRLYKEARVLVRCRITCMDPKKADLKGEILTVGNRFIGKISRMVPYGEHCGEDGTHVEAALLQMMEERTYAQVKKDAKNQPYAVNVPEFAIQKLPQLTEKQLRELAVRQAAARGTA